MNCNTNSWAIEKLMLWRGSWTKYDTKLSNLFLRVLYDQLLITADTKVLESFNVHHKIKGIYKEDILILIVNNSSHEIRKIKFQVKSDITQCLQSLGQHFPIIHHNSMRTGHVMNAKYRNVDDVLRHAIENKDIASTTKSPNIFSNFVKLCLLDPTFPQLVVEAEKIVNDEIIKKS